MKSVFNTMMGKTYKKNDKKARYILSIISIVLLMILGLNNPIYSIMSFIISVIFLCFTNNENAVCMMFFLLPYANIFKVTPDTTSFYTYLSLILVVKMILSVRSIKGNFLLSWILLFLIQIIGCDFDISLLIKQAVILLLVYGYFNTCKKITIDLVLNLAYGTISSCVIGMFYDRIPGLLNYMRKVQAYEISSDMYRFTGLSTDPNYLTLIIIILLISLLALIFQNQIQKQKLVICVVLVYFGLLTVSKSFLGMLGVGYLLCFIIVINKKKYAWMLLMFLGGLLFVAMFFSGKITVFDNIILRLKYSSDITTGRMAIWLDYIDYLVKHPSRIVIGNGINAPSLGHLPHNTYIDFAYHYGFIGTGLFLLGLWNLLKGQRMMKSIANFAPIICFGIMIFFLSYLVMYDFPYILILVIDFACKPKKDIGRYV